MKGAADRRSQKGIAVVMAMLVVALAVVVATHLFLQQRAWVDLLTVGVEREQLVAYARGGVHWARSILRDDWARERIDHLGKPWMTPLPMTVIEDDVELGGAITEMSGRFNLNALVDGRGIADEHMVSAYRRLLSQLGLPLVMADELADWLDADGTRRLGGEEDPPYLSGMPPRLPGNRRLFDLGDLMQVNGYTQQIIDRLRPFVSILPTVEPLNVNTAPPEVLSAYIADLSPGEAATLVAGRNAYFRDTLDFVHRMPRSDIHVDRSLIDVQSSYFLVRANVRRGLARITMHALLFRAPAAMPVIVWERTE